jgi:hypothetical protein
MLLIQLTDYAGRDVTILGARPIRESHSAAYCGF